MKNEENLQDQNTEMTTQDNNYQMMGFEDIGSKTATQTNVFTNIKDSKKIFNLEIRVDNMINDCEGEKIRIKEILIKRFEKPLKEPIIDEKTGEILKETEVTMSCVIVDDNDKSYATGSKMFIIQLMKLLQMKSRMKEEIEGTEIKIIKKKVQNSNNKALSFELI